MTSTAHGAGARTSTALVRRLRDALDAALRGDIETARTIADGIDHQPAKKKRDVRMTLSISPEVEALLTQTGHPSAYVEAVIESHWEEWSGAMTELTSWTRGELHAACDALNGHWLLAGSEATVWAELADAEKLNGTATRHGVGVRRWSGRVALVRDTPVVARAICTVVREWWIGNAALERMIARLPE